MALVQAISHTSLKQMGQNIHKFMEEMRHSYKIMVRKPDRNRPVRRNRHR
jgi:hypothetical protein